MGVREREREMREIEREREMREMREKENSMLLCIVSPSRKMRSVHSRRLGHSESRRVGVGSRQTRRNFSG